MHKPTLKKIIKDTTCIVLFIASIFTFLFAQDRPDTISELKMQSRLYRNKGLQLQNNGDLDGAIGFYQKSIQLDPTYATAYNDLGIVYELKGLSDLAEENYLKAIKIDPNYLSAYSNLALFYEDRRDLKKASFYWQKRIDLGFSSDPWVIKAKRRLEDINLVLGKKPQESNREQEIIDFINEVSVIKSMEKQDSAKRSKEAKETRQTAKTTEAVKIKEDRKTTAAKYFQEAQSKYQKGEYLSAYMDASEAQILDPSNKVISEFLEELQRKLLSR